jgi:hypothetical protein
MDRYVDRSQLCVLGAGAFAAALRVRLRALARPPSRKSVFENGSSDDGRSLSFEPALFVACSDFENASLWPLLAERVLADDCSILFACLTQSGVRVGPLIASGALVNASLHYLTRSWDFSPYDTCETNTPTCSTLTSIADRRRTGVAQIGATVVVRELAKILSRRRENRPGEGVAENDSPSDEKGNRVTNGAMCGHETIVAMALECGRLMAPAGRPCRPEGPVVALASASTVGPTVGQGTPEPGCLGPLVSRSVGQGCRVWHPGGLD